MEINCSIGNNGFFHWFWPKKLQAKVLFIFRCSKNWQKKSVHHHLLTIFTAAKDEKYFRIFFSLFQSVILFRKTTENPIHLKRNKRSFECSGIAGDLISAKAFKILTRYTIKYVFCIKKDCRGVYSSIYIAQWNLLVLVNL